MELELFFSTVCDIWKLHAMTSYKKSDDESAKTKLDKNQNSSEKSVRISSSASLLAMKHSHYYINLMKIENL